MNKVKGREQTMQGPADYDPRLTCLKEATVACYQAMASEAGSLEPRVCVSSPAALSHQQGVSGTVPEEICNNQS